MAKHLPTPEFAFLDHYSDRPVAADRGGWHDYDDRTGCRLAASVVRCRLVRQLSGHQINGGYQPRPTRG
jgi:hypothetical protein